MIVDSLYNVTQSIINDRLGRPITVQDVDMGKRDFTYTAFGELETETINKADSDAELATYHYPAQLVRRPSRWCGARAAIRSGICTPITWAQSTRSPTGAAPRGI
jgi:YD repeat-containing protein